MKVTGTLRGRKAEQEGREKERERERKQLKLSRVACVHSRVHRKYRSLGLFLVFAGCVRLTLTGSRGEFIPPPLSCFSRLCAQTPLCLTSVWPVLSREGELQQFSLSLLLVLSFFSPARWTLFIFNCRHIISCACR